MLIICNYEYTLLIADKVLSNMISHCLANFTEVCRLAGPQVHLFLCKLKQKD